MSSEFGLVIEVDDSTTTMVARVVGDFDAARVPRFESRVRQHLSDELTAIVIDVTGTTLIDSAALGALLRVANDCAAKGIEFSVALSEPFHVDVMQVSGMGPILNAYVRGDHPAG